MTSHTAARPARTIRRRPLLLDLVRAEWTKLRTLRSSGWTLLCAATAMVGFGIALTAAYVRHSGRASLDPAAYTQSGIFFAQLAIGVLGVLMTTGEYATGSIRSTVAAAPQRLLVLTAKATVFVAVSFTTCLIAALAALLAGQVVYARSGIAVDPATTGAARTVLGSALYLTCLGLLSLGLGALIRRTAGALSVLIVVLFFLPASVGALPSAWQNHINPYLPSVAGQTVVGHTRFTPPGPLLSPWTGFVVCCAYTAAVLIAAAITFHRRDT